MKDKLEVKRKQIAFGSYIRNKRERLNYTQEQMAELLGLSRVAYLRYENGERGMDLDSMMVIADELRFSIDDFINQYKKGEL